MQNPLHKIMVRRRVELGLSQAQAAARAGVSRTTWNAWEHVDEFPRMEKWKTIAKVLEVPIEELEQAGAMSWFLQCGPSRIQLALMNTLDRPLDGPMPNLAFYSAEVQKLDRELEVDISRISFDWWGKELATMRGNLRNALLAQDAAYQALSQMVRTFKALFGALLPMRSQTYSFLGKKPKVRKKPTVLPPRLRK